jgi:Kef-type K+ transport system membrane component KefB
MSWLSASGEESSLARILITLGALLLLGLLTDLLGRRTPLPRVTLLIFFGFVIGPSVMGLLPTESREWFPVAADLALVMVGFLLGGALSLQQLRKRGRTILLISSAKVITAFIVVGSGLILLGQSPVIALLLAAVATATAPAATADVVREQHGEGEFVETLLGVVAIDDAWGLMLFSLTLAVIEATTGTGSGGNELLVGIREIGGALLLGVGIGIPTAYLTGRLDPGEPTLAEALGVVFLCGGLAMWLHVSFLLAAMALGATVASLARHHRRPFHAIEGIEWPFMILFFLLAGASIEIEVVTTLGTLIVAYVALRAGGIVLGATAGSKLAGAGPHIRRWLGVALLPQAGVALGMALVAAERFPERAQELLPVAIAATAFFELVGPVFTRLAVQRAS